MRLWNATRSLIFTDKKQQELFFRDNSVEMDELQLPRLTLTVLQTVISIMSPRVSGYAEKQCYTMRAVRLPPDRG